MAYVDIYGALRLMVRMTDGEDLGSEWIGREGLGVDWRGWLGDFMPAADLLGQIILSEAVKVSVLDRGARRQLADDERGYRLDMARGELAGLGGEPRLCGVLICVEDLERFMEPVPTPAKAGRREEHEWVEAKQYLEKIWDERGDPANEQNQVEGWRSDTNVANAVLDHLGKHAKSSPDFGTVRNKIRPWLKDLRARVAFN
jgi:hypothetical protein